MFTGIVRAIGRVAALKTGSEGRRLSIETGALATEDWRIGDSVAVSGVCLTAVALEGRRFDADLSEATLGRTTLGRLSIGGAVNLEPAVTAASMLGGHLVTGHVDGTAILRQVTAVADGRELRFEAPRELLRFIAARGSVAVDGVSLTVAETGVDGFAVHLVPHTLASTTLGALETGQSANLEVDLVARYLDRLLEARAAR